MEAFERGMERLADTEHPGQGRWIVTPRKGMAFIGPRARAEARARQRRRRVFVFMLETIALTFLIGLVPPLRAMWYASAVLVGLLGVYVWMLVSIRGRSRLASPAATAAAAAPDPVGARPARHRYAADASGRTARPAFDGLAALAGEDFAAIVVRPAGRRVVAGV